MTASTTRIVIRHLSGSKVNQIEQFDLDGLQEITLGRDPTSKISYDLQRDDEVSRKHAVIRIKNDKELYFRIADQNSSNGTFLNGERIGGEVELLPDDVVELGSSGPKFIFDVQPRPANLPSRTRQMGALEAAATRVLTTTPELGATVEHTAASDTRQRTATTDTASVARVPIGKNTIQRMLFDERRKTSQFWIASTAAILVLAVLGGGALFWHNRNVGNKLEQEIAAATARAENARADATKEISKQLGIGPETIKTLGDSTVYIENKWALFDQETRKPLFQRQVKLNNEWMPAFVRMSDGTVVRWLTLEDKGGYLPVGEDSSGSGFVFDAAGFILTNKHMAAAWKTRYEDYPANGQWKGVVYNLDSRPSRYEMIANLRDLDRDGHLANWIPESGGYVFDSNRPIRVSSDRRSFLANNEVLTVQFPGTRIPVTASLLRSSIDADVAVLKIDAPGHLDKLELVSKDYNVQLGQHIILLGYPGVSQKTIAVQQLNEGGRVSTRSVVIPEPTVTEGVISKLSPPRKDQSEVTTLGTLGDTYQLDIFASGGDSGGPVLNSEGKVLGLLTYGSSRAEHVSFAVPVKYVRELLQVQRDASP
jgi:S1-C subfamily serine protease/pSer/pThr/pTyr-binding forkhead associated (FHA) protein